MRLSPALFCGVKLIEWTTVEVCVMVDDRRVCAKREHWHEAALHSQHAGEVPAPDAIPDAITKTTLPKDPKPRSRP